MLHFISYHLLSVLKTSLWQRSSSSSINVGGGGQGGQQESKVGWVLTYVMGSVGVFTFHAAPALLFQEAASWFSSHRAVPTFLFQEAVSWFSSHRAVKDGGIGVVAVSSGAQFALLMAWQCPQVLQSWQGGEST